MYVLSCLNFHNKMRAHLIKHIYMIYHSAGVHSKHWFAKAIVIAMKCIPKSLLRNNYMVPRSVKGCLKTGWLAHAIQIHARHAWQKFPIIQIPHVFINRQSPRVPEIKTIHAKCEQLTTHHTFECIAVVVNSAVSHIHICDGDGLLVR